MKTYRRQHVKNRKTSKRKRNIPIFGIWGKYGSVFNPNSNSYVRIGSLQSLNVIVNILERDAEWKKKIDYMMNQKGPFGKQLRDALLH
jgi:hypothetical protein